MLIDVLGMKTTSIRLELLKLQSRLHICCCTKMANSTCAHRWSMAHMIN